MKSFITGSNGFIGSHLVELLVQQKHDITCLIRKTSNLEWIQNLPVRFIYGDITDIDSLTSAVKNMDYIFHLGGTVRAKSESDYYKINHLGTENLLKACYNNAAQIRKFIFVSSQAASGPAPGKIPLKETDEPVPISIYGKSKLKAEGAVLNYRQHFPVSIIRPPSVYGPRDDDILELFKYIKWRVKPVVGFKDKYISIIHVRDIVKGFLRAAEQDEANGQRFFMANRKYHSTLELENIISTAMGKRAVTIRIPEIIIDLIASASELFSRLSDNSALINRDKALELKQRFWIMDSSKARDWLGFKSEITIEDGVKDTLDWYKSHRWI